MVSPLWSACAEGNIDIVLSLLNQASPVDIEIKDHTGATPLLEAVKKGHVDVVKALLVKGADPSLVSLQGGIESLTSNPEIIDLLNHAPTKALSYEAQGTNFSQDPDADPSKRYYPVPAHHYGFYPPVTDAPPTYYQHPPMPVGENGAYGHLPPPDVARYIPCKYYPACRFGSSCLFAHPPGPYYTGPPPPAQYPAPYDPMAQQQYPHNYYLPSHRTSYPPSAPLPPHMNPLSPPSGPVHTPSHPPVVHARSHSDALSPVQPPFSPNGAPPPPFGPMSSVSPYPPPPHPLPLSIPSLPPPHQPATARGPQSPQSMFPNGPVSAPPFSVRQDPVPYPLQGSHPNSAYPDLNGGPKSPSSHTQGDNYGPIRPFPQGGNHRRGNMRRGPFWGNRKSPPACIFFPAGRCRNGNDCRFPHVSSDASGPQPHLGGRAPRAREVPNGISTIEENMATMTVQETQPRRNGTTNSSRSQSTDPGTRSKGSKHIGPRADKKPVLKQQRVPNADEFPVLGGAASPKYLANGGPITNGSAGPTAAQVLQAPAPARKDPTKESTTRSASPEERQVKAQVENRLVECNGVHINGTASSVPTKLLVSFAAVATGIPDVAKELSVPA